MIVGKMLPVLVAAAVIAAAQWSDAAGTGDPHRSAPSQVDSMSVLPGVVVGVVDGDTADVRLDSGMVRVRFHAIDAPESGQKCKDASGALVRCGSTAANALDAWINRNPVTCISEGKDRYQRVLGKCSVRGTSVQDWLVRNGHAVAYREYSTEFVPAEIAAREAKAGIWAGEFVMPWDWRKGVRLEGEPPTKATAGGR